MNLAEHFKACAMEERSVDDVEKKTATTTTTGESRRSIKFAENVCQVVGTVPPLDSYTQEDYKAFWHSEEDYKQIRLDAKFVTKDIRQRDRDLVECIDDAFTLSLRLSCEMKDEASFLHFMKNDLSSQSSCLKDWAQRKISGRGLEKYASRKHHFERTEFARETRSSVVRLAQNPVVTAEQLSVFYREYSRSAAIFARMTGEADNMAAKEAMKSSGILSSSLKCSPTNSENRRRELMLATKSPSRGRILVTQLSQRALEAVV